VTPPAGSNRRLHDVVGEVVERVPAPARHIASALQGKDVLLVSAGLAFYALVSVAPFVVLALWLTSLVVGVDQVRQVSSELASHAPTRLGIDTAFQRVADLGTDVGWRALVAAAWPATAYGAGLVRAFDRLSDAERRELKALRGRGMALGLVVMLPALVLVVLVLSYVVSIVLGDGGPARVAGWMLSLVVGFAATLAVTALIYRVFPHTTPPWDALVKGAAVAAGAIAVLSLAYVVYIGTVADFEQRYVTSGLAAVVLLALWLFLANAFLLVGYQVAIELSTRR
jgi:membrane protein